MLEEKHYVIVSNPSKPNYNPIFEELVFKQEKDSQERLVGMIAYAKYKLDKHKWVKKQPSYTEKEKEAFLRIYDEEKLEDLLKEAYNTLLEFGEEYAAKKLKLELDEQKSSELFKEIRKNKTTLREAILQGCCASLVFGIFVFISGALFTVQSPNSGVGKIINFLTSPEQKAPSSTK